MSKLFIREFLYFTQKLTPRTTKLIYVPIVDKHVNNFKKKHTPKQKIHGPPDRK